MIIDFERASSVRDTSIKQYEDYVTSNGVVTEDKVQYLPTMVMVGYFLKVHSASPMDAVRKFMKSHSLPYRKANEVKTILTILEK